MADQNSILNDPTMTPFITHDGECLVTGDPEGRFLIVSSSLPVRFTDATDDDNKYWLKTPPRQVRSTKQG
jgi:hypothetical protein